MNLNALFDYVDGKPGSSPAALGLIYRPLLAPPPATPPSAFRDCDTIGSQHRISKRARVEHGSRQEEPEQPVEDNGNAFF